MKKVAIIAIAAIAMFLTAGSSKMSKDIVTPIVSVTSDEWTGEIWVQKFTYENEGRVVVDWHLMATNTTGEGSCVEGLIRYNGRKITVVGYVPASAYKREKAVSIYHLPNKFEIIPDTFYSTDDDDCL